MGNFDWLLGAEATSGNMGMGSDAASLAASQESGFTPQRTGGVVNEMENLLNAPNIIRGMGEMGASISGGTPIMQAVGTGAANLVGRRASQAAGESQLNRQSYQQQQIQEILAGRGLSPLDDNTAPDTFSINGNGDMTWGMKNSPIKEETFLGTQMPQEAMNTGGGFNLPDFL